MKHEESDIDRGSGFVKINQMVLSVAFNYLICNQ